MAFVLFSAPGRGLFEMYAFDVFDLTERRSAAKGTPDSLRHPKRCDNCKSKLAHLNESEKPVTALAGLAAVLEGVELVIDEFWPSLLALRPPTSHRN